MFKAVLFDIDGTLMSTGGAGKRAMKMAFEALTHVGNAFDSISMAGKTDPLIIKEALIKHNREVSNQLVEEILDVYVSYLRSEIKISQNKHLKPGIAELLNLLITLEVHTGLLTGNIEMGARLKLEDFGLYNHFSFGAFSSDDEDRNNLLPIALKKLHHSKEVIVNSEDCLVVGDTPRDVSCAKPHGAKVIGVATGSYTNEELYESGADWVFYDLGDTQQVLDIITG